MKKNSFQKGDVVVPLETRKQSLYYDLTTLKKGEVQLIQDDQIRIKILEGHTKHRERWGISAKGDCIWVGVNAFKLEKPKVDTYDIF